MNDWLPDKKYYEFSYHKFYNPEVEYKSWQPWAEWDYPDRDILRFSHIIKDQVSFIKNKKVLDLACHLGYLSLFALHNGAQFVTGTNVRQNELSIANEICNLAGYDNYSFLVSNIYDQHQLGTLVEQHDTILLCGILYHVNNHYDLLKTLCKQNKTLIIETCLSLFEKHESTTGIDVPAMVWRSENTADSVNAFENDKETSFVGYPNRKWLHEALESLDMNIEYDETCSYVSDLNLPKKRIIMRATKK